MNKTFLKSFLVIAALIVAVSLQSCSNPFNPASKFTGKWRVVSNTNVSGGEVQGDWRRTSFEFLPDEKTVVMVYKSRVTITNSFEIGKGNIVKLAGNGSTWRYEFKGNQLILKGVGDTDSAVLEKE